MGHPKGTRPRLYQTQPSMPTALSVILGLMGSKKKGDDASAEHSAYLST